MIGLQAFATKMAPTAPKLNRKRAQELIARVDAILAWEQRVERDRETRFVELGQALCEIRARQYWRLEELGSFDEFLEKRFPGSRRKAYYWMSLFERMPKQTHPQLREIGWSKSIELTRLVRKQGERFQSATWLHKAREMPKEKFKQAVEKELTGRDESYDLVTFKLYKSQLSVVEQALDTAAMLLGSDKPRSYCLEMICADFLAGVHQQEGNWELVSMALLHTFKLLPREQQIAFLQQLRSEDYPEETEAQVA